LYYTIFDDLFWLGTYIYSWSCWHDIFPLFYLALNYIIKVEIERQGCIFWYFGILGYFCAVVEGCEV
jgi:hypothetical protein